MSGGYEGGDPPCWAHLFDDDHDECGDGPDEQIRQAEGLDVVVADLGSASLGSGGAIWSLPHGGDLDANLVRLDAGGVIGAHVNDEVDVLVVVQSGHGRLTIDGTTHQLRADFLVLIPRGVCRSVDAGPMGVTYLSIHRRRGPLQLSHREPPATMRETLPE